MFARARVAQAKLKVPKEVKQHLRFLNLGVGSLADGGRMKERYRELAKRYHPDVNRGDDGRMKELNRAYREVLVFADDNAEAIGKRAGDADADGGRKARFGEDVAGKSEEVSLVTKLARWMRRGDDEADAARAKAGGAAANPAAEYRAYVDQAREEVEQFGTVLGTEEQEMAWAERFEAEREAQLDGRKNAEKTRKREERLHDNPFDPTSAGSLDRRVAGISLVSEPRLYREGLIGTSVRPELDAERAAFLGVAKAAAARENPHLARRAEKKKKWFYESEAPWSFETERRDAAARKRKNVARWIEKMNRNLLAPDGGSFEMNALSKALERTHNGSMEALTAGSPRKPSAAPWQRHAVDVNALGFRAPKSLRKSGNLVTLKQNDPATGKPTMVQMSSGAFLKKGLSTP